MDTKKKGVLRKIIGGVGKAALGVALPVAAGAGIVRAIRSHPESIRNALAKALAKGRSIDATVGAALPGFFRGSPKNEPSTITSRLKGAKADRDRNIIKTARSYKGAPNLGGMSGKEPTDAMKARVAAENVINPIGKKIRPGMNRRSLGWAE